MMGIDIVKADITQMDVDAVVNAANEGLLAGGGVCGAIFQAAGYRPLQKACDAIGHCDTGDAVMTPGFALRARHVIHAVGPRWHGGADGEAELLASCYARSLDLAAEHGCSSVAFPLISSGIFGYPKQAAWRVALGTCAAWLKAHGDAGVSITFCVLSDGQLDLGRSTLASLGAV